MTMVNLNFFWREGRGGEGETRGEGDKEILTAYCSLLIVNCSLLLPALLWYRNLRLFRLGNGNGKDIFRMTDSCSEESCDI